MTGIRIGQDFWASARPSPGKALLALAALVLAVGCSCDEQSDGVEVNLSFVQPETEGATLGCEQDLDRETAGLQARVVLFADLKSEEADGYTVRLTVDGTEQTAEAAVPFSGRVEFEDFTLENGEATLVAELLLDESVVATARRAIQVSLDPATCTGDAGPDAGPDAATDAGEPQPLTLSFVSPLQGAVLGSADDLDRNLANELQVAVEIGVVGVPEGEVELLVAGQAAGRAAVVDGVARFAQVTLPVGSGAEPAFTLEAKASNEAGEASASVEVQVVIDGCAITMTPSGGGPCDISGGSDVDQDIPGIQVELEATTACGDVVFVVNGTERDPVALVDGKATLIVTFPDGENTVQARTATEGGLTGETPVHVLNVRSTIPVASLALNEIGVNTLGLDEADPINAEGATWTLAGFAEGMDAGQRASLIFEPALEGAPADAVIGEDGHFEVDVAATYWCGTVKVGLTDACGVEAESPAYSLCLDSIVPELSIVTPASGAIIGPDQDDDPDSVGRQLAVTVQVDDPRPDASYTVGVACAPVSTGVYVDRTTAGLLTSELSEEGTGVVLITLGAADVGNITCRATSDAQPNTPDASEAAWLVITARPSFALLSPEDGACFGADVVVGGSGQQLDQNGAALMAVVSPAEGEALEPVPLGSVGGDQYQVVFGAPAGPEALLDGDYTVVVQGEITGPWPIAVSPAEGINFTVDTLAPELSVVSPPLDAPLGIALDTDSDLHNCVQAPVVLQVADATSTEACYRLNGGARRCAALAEDGTLTTVALSFLEGENALEVSASDCAGNEGVETFTFTTEGCPQRIVVVDPADGAQVPAGMDLDLEAEGIQLDVRLTTGLPEGTEVEVLVDGEAVFGPGLVDESGEVVVQVTIPIPEEHGDPLPFTLQGRSGEDLGPIAELGIAFALPAIVLDHAAACVNAAAVDASLDAGFQIAVTGHVDRIEVGTEARLTVTCGAAAPVETTALVTEGGRVTFLPTVSDGICELRAQIADRAGQEAVDETSVLVDRTAPTVSFRAPTEGQIIGLLQDLDSRPLAEANGIQYQAQLRVCGAAEQALTVTTVPAIAPSVVTVPDEGECMTVLSERRTLPLGTVTYGASVADACGNPATAQVSATVDAGASLTIQEPDDQETLNLLVDTAPAQAGCQLELQATAVGFPDGTVFTACADAGNGPQPAACNGGYQAGTCRVINAEGSDVRCDISVPDGQRTLSVVGVLGSRIQSSPISVRADCAAPSVESLIVVQDDGDGCVNRQERANPDSALAAASISVRLTTSGLEDNQPVDIRKLPGDTLFNRGRVVGDQVLCGGALCTGSLEPGEYVLYARGTDLAGNALPTPDLPTAITRPLLVDTVVPTPSLINLVSNQCLNAAADQGAGAGLQYGIHAQMGGSLDEVLLTRLSVDGVLAEQVDGALSEVNFQPVSFAEGTRALTLTVEDACGNVGSIAGFNQASGRDDWTSPRSLSFKVDTVAPGLVLNGLSANQVLTAANDADNDTSNGFQVDVTVDRTPVESLEQGQELFFFSGAARLDTAPNPVLNPAGAAALPARLTLTPGVQSLTARATDVCGNEGRSAAVPIDVQVSGCASILTGLLEDPAILGQADGVVEGTSLRINGLGAEVSLLDPDCANGQAFLMLDGVDTLAGPIVVGADGEVTFPAVAIPRAAHTLTVRVLAESVATLSPARQITVDILAPTVAITTPTAGAHIVTDTDPTTAGQQMTVVAQVTENPVTTSRTAVLTVNGVPVPGSVAVAGDNTTNVSFSNVTLPVGTVNFSVCVTDQSGNQGCGTRTANADPAAPAMPGALTAVILDRRLPDVDLTLVAPREDGATGGRVATYEVRRSPAVITDANFSLAILTGTYAATVDPGAVETLPLDGLPQNELRYIAVQAKDEAGRVSTIATTTVDLRLSTATFSIVPTVGAWNDSNAFTAGTTNSLVAAVGDVDKDGFKDILAGASRDDGTSQVSLIFGSATPATSEVRNLALPGVMDATVYFASALNGVGDVNGDGAPDFAILGVDANYEGVIGLYLGCTAANCNRATVASPDAVIRTPGRFPAFLAGAGNWVQPAADGATVYGDLIIGGDYYGGANAIVVAGRGTWPASLTATTYTIANGAYSLSAGGTLANAGIFAAGVGDQNGDGYSEIALSAGDAFNDSYIFMGGAALAATLVHGGVGVNSYKLVHPCAGASPSFGSFFAGGVDLTGDVNHRPDFLVGDRSSKRIAVFNQDRTSTDCISRGETVFGIVMDLAGDFNGDGRVDLIATHRDAGNTNAYLFYNDGTGRFGIGTGLAARTPDVSLGLPAYNKLAVAGVGDFNGDGRADVAAVIKAAGEQLQVVVYY